MSYNIREAKKILYSLKRMFGIPVLAVDNNGKTHNHTTGALESNYNETHLNRVIVLTERDARIYVQDLAYITANRNFTSGGLLTLGKRVLIIDGSYSYVPTLKTHFEFDDEKWRASKIDTILNNTGHLVQVTRVDGNDVVGGA